MAGPYRQFNTRSRLVRTALMWVDQVGWVLGENSELLFWVPPDLRRGLFRAESPLVMGRTIKTKFNLEMFVHGESWVHCKEGSA
jgi:hypothetical protein